MESAGKLLEGLASATWAALAVWILYTNRHRIADIAALLADRIRGGSSVEIGWLKFAELKVVAIANQPALERKVGPVSITRDRAFQKVILSKQRSERFTFLVHYAYPLQKEQGAHDVVLYLVCHFNRLEGVVKVEHFLGEGWGNALFTCEDRETQFAIKVQAVGSFLSMARIYHHDGTVVEQCRFVELEALH